MKRKLILFLLVLLCMISLCTVTAAAQSAATERVFRTKQSEPSEQVLQERSRQRNMGILDVLLLAGCGIFTFFLIKEKRKRTSLLKELNELRQAQNMPPITRRSRPFLRASLLLLIPAILLPFAMVSAVGIFLGTLDNSIPDVPLLVQLLMACAMLAVPPLGFITEAAAITLGFISCKKEGKSAAAIISIILHICIFLYLITYVLRK